MTDRRRWRLLVAYDGSGFRGFAAQSGVRTVAGRLGEAIGRAVRLEDPPRIVCAGRTDAGVHAEGQVVHVDVPSSYSGDLAAAVNRQVSPEVVVRDARPVEDTFDARRTARWRHYRYLVHDAPSPDPLLAPVVWHVASPLDVHAMATATDPILGEHDFRAFCRRAPGSSPEDPIVRRVLWASWRRVDGCELGEGVRFAASDPHPAPGLLRFDIVATSFCHQMVRSIVAVLVDAGLGRSSAAVVMAFLRSSSRAGAPKPAPPGGLCLVEVGYGPGSPSDGPGLPSGPVDR